MATERRNDHRDLLLWRKALELTIDVHETTKKFPRQELFGLVSQLRRAAVSIPSNIAEGSARPTTKEFISFLHIARGSLAELDTQLLLAQRFGYLTEAETNNLVSQVNEVGRLSMPSSQASAVAWIDVLHYPLSPIPYPLSPIP